MVTQKTYLPLEQAPPGWCARLTKLLGQGVRAQLEATGRLSAIAECAPTFPERASEEGCDESDNGPIVDPGSLGSEGER